MKRFIENRLLGQPRFNAIRLVGNLFDRRLPRFRPRRCVFALKRLNFWVIRIKSRRLWTFSLLCRNGVREIWIFSVLDSLCNPNRVVLRKLDLGSNVRIKLTPDLAKFEECRSSLEGICSLPGFEVNRCAYGCKPRGPQTYLVALLARTALSARLKTSNPNCSTYA